MYSPSYLVISLCLLSFAFISYHAHVHAMCHIRLQLDVCHSIIVNVVFHSHVV